MSSTENAGACVVLQTRNMEDSGTVNDPREDVEWCCGDESDDKLVVWQTLAALPVITPLLVSIQHTHTTLCSHKRTVRRHTTSNEKKLRGRGTKAT